MEENNIINIPTKQVEDYIKQLRYNTSTRENKNMKVGGTNLEKRNGVKH